ncbi:gamma-glutamylcyclotransferase (GGCT)/AIG2-like uncharacterized protein YtfP [Mucilaginibacter yixingensis]|uniref:Gamma-glutamylcyclotransferase (GGCT)/AIG2-like uncharacterized protein YtfP n=1 Tax=Mucilaginibacter yixingensis TaxID=1295612 RepID=A0A2T5JA90_9SPHI|nr:gamma-glutamylcyclotransferase family protein [Mucilaginibacter yixingensis]PTQ96990.1 gamma-glutamylcyclotransferase (GGCT)/AIG2-like uncharacterized protein YtfP [Mucilaginibacter yixingensis]
MTSHSPYLFIYGTLLDSGNRFGAFLQANSKLIGAGSFSGRLYDIGHYPGAFFDETCGLKVHGQIVELPDPDKVLSYLDPYEGIGPENEEPYEYTREVISIETENGLLNCWVYLYNHPVNGYRQILSGKYV